jgi:two-component system response regulator RegX3
MTSIDNGKPPKHYDCLIIDDEYDIAAGTCEYFNISGVHAQHVQSAEDALLFLREHSARVILLDINLGGDSGFALCKTLREITDIPILFISARTSSDDQLLALTIGGDDYITKPYTLSVLLAKVKAVLKRYGTANIDAQSRLNVDPSSGRILLDGTALELKNMENKLLKYLLENKGRIISKDELFREVWGDAFVSDGTLNVHIRRLREKIEENPGDPMLIKTVWGVGFVYEEGEAVK